MAETPPDLPMRPSGFSGTIRVSILQTLWDAFESGRGGDDLSYSELFEAVDYDDSGNFSYHLQKLTGPSSARLPTGTN